MSYRLYRQKYVRDGVAKYASNWYVAFHDHKDIPYRWPLFPQERRSQKAADLIEKLVSVRAGVEAMSRELQEELEAMPEDLRKRLLDADIIAPERITAGLSMRDHLEGVKDAAGKLVKGGFRQSVEAKNAGADFVNLIVARARHVIEGCGFTSLTEIRRDRVEHWLSEQRKVGTGHDGKGGMSARTSNFHLQAIKRFCEWAADDGRAIDNPLRKAKGIRVEDDPRHNRRALSEDEQRRLLDATYTGKTHAGVTGEERWLAYRFALTTGMRPKQMRSLTRADFDFDKNTVTARARYAKAKREATLTMRSDLATLMREHLKGKMPGAPAFHLLSDQMRIRVFRYDLEAARQAWLNEAADDPEEYARRDGSDFLRYRDSAGDVADAYSLRHAFITELVHRGASPDVVRRLAQHAKVTTTLAFYAKSKRTDEAAAVETLPALPDPPKKSADTASAAG